MNTIEKLAEKYADKTMENIKTLLVKKNLQDAYLAGFKACKEKNYYKTLGEKERAYEVEIELRNLNQIDYKNFITNE
jgi:hypothetical protein